MIVLKFGGTSVSSLENINRIKHILETQEEDFIVVVSAFSGVTNMLENIANTALSASVDGLLEEFRNIHLEKVKEMFLAKDQTELLVYLQERYNQLERIAKSIHTLGELSDKTRARIMSTGEELSSTIIHRYLHHSGMDISYLDSSKLIITDDNYISASVDFDITNANIQKTITRGKYIAPGYIASDKNGTRTVLGRGGSDYSASIYAAATNASRLELWSDIDGLHNADPRYVDETYAIKQMSYKEAFELAYFGAKVVYPPSILPVMKGDIPLFLKNTFYPDQEGTRISDDSQEETNTIKGISALSGVSMITVSGIGLTRTKGSARKVFQALEEKGVNIILITQNCSEQSIGFAVRQEDTPDAVEALEQAFARGIERGSINPVDISDRQSIIAIVGDNMKHSIGLSGKVFSALGENGVNVTAIAQGASERNISIVIDQKEEHKALNVLHEKLFRDTIKEINLFIAGVGNVGRQFLRILDSQRQKLYDELRIKMRVLAIANSTRLLTDTSGTLGEKDIDRLEADGIVIDSIDDFTHYIVESNLRNSIFIDNSASNIVGTAYPSLLKESISVITCNKVAWSAKQEVYDNLRHLSKRYQCHTRYETAVGAALPIIKTIKDLRLSGDTLHRIDAVISGSLNFIFNRYDGSQPFADIVMEAKNEGYTEPDPLIDLSGVDVKRKILILARESGRTKEMVDIKFHGFLPEECVQTEGIDELYDSLIKHEDYFKKMYRQAAEKNLKLKVVATMDGDELSVALREIPEESPFYYLEGKDNVVAIYTDRYLNEPLVIKGAGAGAAVTASGVFADLMSVVNL